MTKRMKRIISLFLIMIMAITMFACKKQQKHKWIEVGSDPNPPKVAPGPHPERGSDSDAIPIVSTPIIFPTGRDKNGVQQYVKYFYDMEELTPEKLDAAMKEIGPNKEGLINKTSLFCDLQIIEDAGEGKAVGPDSPGAMLTNKGIVRYVVLDSDIINEGVEGATYNKKTLEGMISRDDVIDCVKQTFEENFQLASCEFEEVTMDEYKKIHGNN